MSVRWQTREQLTHEVVLLARQKVSRRAIARALGVSRNTVKRILAAHSEQREEGHAALAAPPPRLPRASKLDPFKSRVGELLKEYPDITAQRVFEILSSPLARAAAHQPGWHPAWKDRLSVVYARSKGTGRSSLAP